MNFFFPILILLSAEEYATILENQNSFSFESSKDILDSLGKKDQSLSILYYGKLLIFSVERLFTDSLVPKSSGNSFKNRI